MRHITRWSDEGIRRSGLAGGMQFLNHKAKIAFRNTVSRSLILKLLIVGKFSQAIQKWNPRTLIGMCKTINEAVLQFFVLSWHRRSAK